MALWSNIKKYASPWLGGGPSAVESAEDAIFYHQWLTEHGLRIVHNYAPVAAILEALGALLSPFINPPPFDWMGSVFMGALATRNIFWMILEYRIKEEHRRVALRVYSWASTIITGAGVASYVCEAIFNAAFSPGILLVAGMVWGSTAWTIGLATPALGLGTMFLTLIVSIVTVALLYVLDAPGIAKFGWLFVVVDLTIAGFFRQKFDQMKAHALLHKRTAELENQLRLLALNALDRELKVAAAVQSTLALPPKNLQMDGFDIRLFNEPHGALGGDILLTRRGSDGSLVFVVGDVTGKGAPAAMVVQAVLSLWAGMQESGVFSAIKWMELVNATLLRMGREPGLNTMTMGVLVVQNERAEYYRAGHIPLYLQRRVDGNSKVEPVAGTGMPLGLVDDPQIEPVQVDLQAAGACTFWLGTDGIFDWGTRRSSRLVQLIEQIDREGAHAVKSHPVEDDKILVSLHCGDDLRVAS